MAGQGIELGVAYLSLVVSSQGVPAQVRAALSGLPEEGRRAGAALGKSMSDAAAAAARFDRVKASAGSAQLKAAQATNALAQAQQRAAGAASALGAAHTKAINGANSLAAGQQRAASAVASLAAGQQRAASAAASYATAQGKTAQAMSALASGQNRVTQAFSSDARVKTQAAQATDAFLRAQGRTAGSLSTVSGALSRVGVDLSGMTTKAGQGARALEALGGPRIKAGIADVGKQIKDNLGLGLAAGVAAASVSAVNLEATFSQTMAQVAASAQVPAEQMQRLNDLAIKLGADTAFSAGEAADAMLELSKAGLSPATIESGALSATLTQAAASGDNLKDSASAIGNALNMFNLKGAQAAEVAAAFAGGANASTAEVKDLAMGLAQVGPGAASMGMSLQETVGVLAAFNNAGLSGSDAGTSLKTMLTSLVPSSQKATSMMEQLGLYTADVDESLRVLSENGMRNVSRDSASITDAFWRLATAQAGAGASTGEIEKAYQRLRAQAGGAKNAFFDANGEMKSAVEIAGLLQDATKGLSDEQRIQAMSVIFGSDAARAANILAKEGAAGLTKYIQATKDQTAAQDMANARMSGTAGALERLSGAWETFRLQAGQALAPAVTLAADALGNSLGLIGGALKVMVPLIVMSVTAWAAYTATVKTAALATMLMEAWTKRAAIAQALLGGALALNPLGLAVAALAALAVGLVMAWKNSETFRSVVTGAWESVKGAVSSTLTVVKAAFDGFVSAVQAAWGAVSSAVSTVWGAVAPIFTAIGNIVGVVLKAEFFVFKVAVVASLGVVIVAVQTMWAGVKLVFAGIVALINTVVIPAWNALASAVSAAWAFIRDQVFTPIRDWVVSVLVAAFNNFLGNVRRVWTAVQAVISTVWQWVSVNVFTPIRTWLTATLTAALNAFGNVVSTVWNAVRSVIATAWGWISANVFTPIRTWLIDTFGGAFNAFRATVVSVWNTVVRTIASAWQRISGTFSSLKDGLNSVWNWFGVVVGGIGKTWDTLKGAVAAPVRYVVNDIIRDKLVYAWNQVASKVGLSTFAFSGMASGGTPSAGRSTRGGLTRAAGGNVPGWSPNDTADNIPAWLTADEFVTRRKSARKMRKNHPGVLEYINAHGTLPGYRDGGTVARFAGGGSVANWDARTGSGLRVWAAWMRSLISGKFGVRDIGGYRPVDQFPDHPSGRALDIMTYSDRSRGDAIASWLMANHKAANLNYLIWKQRSWNPRRGSWKLMPNRGGITANHFDHVHALFNPGGGNPSGLGGALTPEMIAQLQAGGGGFSVPNPLAEAAKAIVNPLFNGAKALIAGMTSRFGASAWVEMMAATAKMPVDQVQKWLINKIDSVFPASSVGGAGADNEGTPVSAPGAGVQRWASVAARALQMTGQSPSLLPALLRRMQQESGGNPNAINNWDINAKRGDPSKGLMQVIGSTFRRYAMPGYNTNIYDPMSNILASLRYASAKYGSVAAAYNRRGGYSDGGTVTDDTTAKLFDGGGLLEYGDIALHKTRRPDRVLTERQWHAVERYLPTTAGSAGGGLGGARIEINGIKHDSVGEFAQALDYALIRARNVGRYQTIGA